MAKNLTDLRRETTEHNKQTTQLLKLQVETQMQVLGAIAQSQQQTTVAGAAGLLAVAAAAQSAYATIINGAPAGIQAQQHAVGTSSRQQQAQQTGQGQPHAHPGLHPCGLLPSERAAGQAATMDPVQGFVSSIRNIKTVKDLWAAWTTSSYNDEQLPLSWKQMEEMYNSQRLKDLPPRYLEWRRGAGGDMVGKRKHIILEIEAKRDARSLPDTLVHTMDEERGGVSLHQYDKICKDRSSSSSSSRNVLSRRGRGR